MDYVAVGVDPTRIDRLHSGSKERIAMSKDPIEEVVSDTLATAAGILLGLILSIPIWCVIIWALVALFK